MSFLRYFRLSPRSRRTYSLTLPFDVNSYSTNEIDINASWIDGREIYRKVVTFPNGPNFVQLSIGHGITGLDVVVRLWGMMKNAGSDFVTLPYVGESGMDDSDQLSLKADATNVYITPDQETGMDWSAFSGFVVIEYVKTP